MKNAHTFACLAMLSLAACGSGPAPVIPFVDGLGRSCNYDPGASPSVTCDVAPGTFVTCSAPAVPAYILSTGTGTNPVQRNCAACRVDREYTNLLSCADVDCVTSADCPMSNYECALGRCRRNF